MHSSVRFTGVIDTILEQAVKEGLASTKTEALRQGVLELNNKYELLKRARQDDLAIRKMQRIDKEIAEGKRRVVSLDEALAKYKKST